jgi:hypothetical protein
MMVGKAEGISFFFARIFLKENVSFKQKFLPNLHVPHMLFSKRMEATDM